MRIELLLTPGCPHADETRTVLRACLDQLGLDVAVVESVGDHLSPTLLVDGVDAMAAGPRPSGPLSPDPPALSS